MNEVPGGLEHLRFLDRVALQNKSLTLKELGSFPELRSLLGTALHGIYLSSTCARECHGGNHIIEMIGSRAYSLAHGSIELINIGLYDEALNLVRSLGEIANLLVLASVKREKFEEWLASSTEQRIHNFSPAKIRRILGKDNVVMGRSWYSMLCESVTHITPKANPNNYNLDAIACGGIVQSKGVESALDQLTYVVSKIALNLCKYSQLDDIYESLHVAVANIVAAYK